MRLSFTNHVALELSNKYSLVRDSQHTAVDLLENGSSGFPLALTFIYKVPTRLSRIIKAVFR